MSLLGRTSRWRSRVRLGTWGLYAFLVAYSLICLAPFLWLGLASLKNNTEIFQSVIGLPGAFRIENYVRAWEIGEIGQDMINSMIVSIIVVALVILFGSMAAYVLSRALPNRAVYTYFSVGIMIPVLSILIPSFILMRSIGMRDNLVGLAVLYTASSLPLAVFILVGFMRGLPKDLEESAAIDGANRTTTFFRIILPVSRPALAAVGTLTFLYTWNEFLLASVMMSSPTAKTLPLGIFSLQGTWSTEYGPMSAGLILSMLPMLAVYLLFQEQVIEGATAGAVVG